MPAAALIAASADRVDDPRGEQIPGAVVERLGGVDISWIIGLVVPSILYYLFARRDAVPL